MKNADETKRSLPWSVDNRDGYYSVRNADDMCVCDTGMDPGCKEDAEFIVTACNARLKDQQGELRVWWVPQAPMKAFYVEVSSVGEAVTVLQTLADYDTFQLENNIKPDYSNVGGLQMFDKEDKTDSPEGFWVDWYYEDEDRDIYCDDPFEYAHELS